MRGLLADVNVEGHLPRLSRILRSLGLWAVLADLDLRLVTFRDLGFAMDLDDRSLSDACQGDGWVLLTENRNHDGPDSLGAVLDDSWIEGRLPVLTLSSKSKFERDLAYAQRVATDVAELLFGVAMGEYRDRPRIDVPR